ncbi:FAD-dependent oxidoreductase [Actinokineospora sp.]|uniref:FAD-dependent oxidoreductase n=1 Tax=Actinokineospora sp. TaxID=1872133 RepID=UPI004037994E
MRTDRPIIVVGAGVGGLTAALALHRNGLPVEVYERRTVAEILDAPGSGLTLWSNASTPLGWLGLGDRLQARAEPVTAIHSFDARRRVRFKMSTHRHIWPGALPSLSIGRMDLAETLMSACDERGIAIHYGQKVTGYTDGPDGVEVRFENDRAGVVGAALVGADGVRSAILARLHGGEVPGIYLGRTVYRGVIENARGLVAGIPQLFHDEATGIGGGVYPVGDGRGAWTLSVRAPAGERDEPGRLHARSVELARVLPSVLRDMVDQTPGDAIIRTDIWYHEWHENWGVGRVTLLGDAAHAMPNDLGQGACQAVEDAVVLADALVASDMDSLTGMADALRGYERRRFERVKWVREQSVRVATAPEVRNPVGRWLLGKLTRLYLSLAEKGMWRQMQALPELTATGTPVAEAAGSAP